MCMNLCLFQMFANAFDSKNRILRFVENFFGTKCLCHVFSCLLKTLFFVLYILVLCVSYI